MSLFNFYETMKRAIQDVVAPEIQALRGDMTALRSDLQRVESTLDTRITQVESNLSLRIEQVERGLEDLRGRGGRVETTVGETQAVLVRVESGLQDTTKRVERVEGAVERLVRFAQDAEARLKELGGEMAHHRQGLEGLEERSGSVEMGVGETQTLLRQIVPALQNLAERVERLETAMGELIRFAQDAEARLKELEGLEKQLGSVETGMGEIQRSLSQVWLILQAVGDRVKHVEVVAGETQAELKNFIQDTESRFREVRGEVAHLREVMDINIRRVEENAQVNLQRVTERLDVHLQRIDNDLGWIKGHLQATIEIHERLAALEARVT